MQAAKKNEGHESALSIEEAERLLKKVSGWKLLEDKIERDFHLGGFTDAMSFANQVADLAEQLDHHPEIHISYDKVKLELSTHKVGGLSPLDFTLAERIDQLIR